MNKQRPKTTRRSEINVAKNWALTTMLIALAFAHLSSELLLKQPRSQSSLLPALRAP